MGTGTSSLETPGGDLRLPTTGLRFTVPQLHSLNSYVDNLYQQDQMGRMSAELESTVESLVQRIVDGAGQRDPRFRCCHLIALHRGKKMRSRSLEYLVTLDSLPTLNSGHPECHIQEGPAGYSRIQLTGKQAQVWEEFLTTDGYLCRDKVLSRWVELIARCTTARGGGSPRVIAVSAAGMALPYQYCYLERANPPQTASDQRLAIVEGSAWVMVRVGGGRAEAKLVLGARGAGGAGGAGVGRVPLLHPLALLHYGAGGMGFYSVAVGPPSSVACTERRARWQTWSPAAEAALDGHGAAGGPGGRLAGALNALLDRMRDGVVQGSLRVLSRYSVSCALRRRLERCGYYQLAAARALVSSHTSHHFLLVIDELISVCSRRHTAGYITELDRASVSRRGVRTSEADWNKDASCLMNFLQHLHADSATAQEIPPSVSESLETVLFRRWENLLRETKTSTSPPTYSRRQLMYIWRLTSELLKCKAKVVCDEHSAFRANLIQVTSAHQEPIEDVIHILAIMLDQARDLYLANNFSQIKRPSEIEREVTVYRSKKWNKLKDYYDASSACLIDAVRRDADIRNEDLTDPCVIITNILNWLYIGAKDDKKYLGPVLKPYLEGLYRSSLENSWFLEDFDSKKCEKELDGMRQFCMGVHEGKVEPCMGLLDMGKRMAWAKAMIDFVDRSKHVDLRLVFPTGDGMAISYPMRLPSRREHSTARELTLSRRDKAEAKLRLARRCVIAAFSDALIGDRSYKPVDIVRYGSTEEILASVKTGSYWRNSTKPDIIPSPSSDLPRVVKRKSIRKRPVTSYGFPNISISNVEDSKTMSRKYHTLKSLVYSEPVESIKELKQRPRSAGSTLRRKETMSRPNILETLDFINGVKDALCVEESCTSDIEDVSWGASEDWLLSLSQPLSVLTRLTAGDNIHLTLGDVVVALLQRGKFTMLQELCSWLGESSEGALFALHRLGRTARSRSSDRPSNSWNLPESEGSHLVSEQKYRVRHPDYVSEDEAPQPPPLPRNSGRQKATERKYSDFTPPKRLQELECNLKNLELMNLNLTQKLNNTYSSNILNDNYTGIINPVYDERKLKEKFSSAKRSKSLGRSSSSKIALQISRYNTTVGPRVKQRTNDVMTAIMGGETDLKPKSNFFNKYSSTDSVVGDSYKMRRTLIE